jgi:hypothetical protein
MSGAHHQSVRAHLASYNTAEATELCVRTMIGRAGYPVRVTVGDCGSRDGSLEMLQRLADRDVIDLEVAPDGRAHPEWIDRWVQACDARYALISDSDVEYRRSGWLREMVDAATGSDAALVATRIQAVGGVAYTHPATGARRTLAARPEPWLMLIDVEQVRGRIGTSFAYRDEVQPDGTKVAYDTAAAWFRDLDAAGLRWVEMPSDFRRAYRHFGSLSWQRGLAMPWRRRAKQLAKHALVRAKLTVARRRFPLRDGGVR